MELTDTHCHIYLPEFDSDRTATIRNAFAAGVTRIFLPHVDSSTTAGLLDLADLYPLNCFPMMGLHPTSVNAGFEQELEHALALLDTRKIYGIGEVGIDLYWDKSFQAQQEEAFRIQLGWASNRNLPVIIHVRNSHSETVEIIKKSGLTNLTGIFHCFSGTLDQAREIIGMGFHLGIGGVSTFKNSGLNQVLTKIDPKWIVLETDSPYLAPVPFRGKRNEPSYLVHTASKVANIYSMSIVELAKLTTNNSKRLFGI
ncbi:MAG: TatD family hydrolase [Bacteroidia bacterium]|nr:TatD family hydrolase [Bacteroidia bacterium]